MRDGKHALKRYVEQHPQGGVSRRVAWAHGLVTPFTSFDDDFSVPESPRWALTARTTSRGSRTGVPTNVRLMEHGQRPPTHDDV